MNRSKRSGFSLIELLIVVAIIGIVAAIAIPSLLRSRMAAQETAAIGDSNAMVKANANYAKANRGCYATTTVLLGVPLADIGTVPFLDTNLSQATPYVKNGYDHDYIVDPGPVSCCSRAGAVCMDPGGVTWNYVSNPQSWGATGTRAFSVDHSGMICEQVAPGTNWVASPPGVTPACGTGTTAPISQ